MTALAADKIVPYRAGRDFSAPVEAAKLIYQGALVVLNAAGNAQPGTSATALVAAGVAQEQADNSAGAAGDINVPLRAGLFRFANAGDIDRTSIGKTAYIVDDQTVALSSSSGARSIAGPIEDYDASGVWVRIGGESTLRTFLTLEVGTLVGAGVYRTVSPVAGKVVKIWDVTNGALTTGDATLTAKIGATAITTGVITITQAGSAAGDVDSCVPTAANTVAVGDVLSVTVGGTNATASTSKVLFEIES